MAGKDFFMIKAFNQATLQILRSTQTVYYKINSPSVDEMALIYKQGDLNQFISALAGYKPGSVLVNGDGLLHHFNHFYDSQAIGKILETKKISPNYKNNNGSTALLHLATISSKEENGKFLNKEQTQVNSEEYVERLYEINTNIKKASLDIGTLYINNGADVNITDIFGNTAIYYALKKNNLDLALQISKAPNFEASTQFREKNYQDAFDIATEKPQGFDVAISIFLNMNMEQRIKKMSEIHQNLYISESLLIACESMTKTTEESQKSTIRRMP